MIYKKKKTASIILTIIIVILILVIIGLVGYILYDKGIIFSKEDNSIKVANSVNTNEDEADNKKEEKDKYSKEIALDSEIVTDLIKHMHVGVNSVEISSEIYGKSRIKGIELSNQTKLIIGILENGYYENNDSFIPASAVVRAVKKVLGPDMTVIHEDINILCGPSYDTNQKGYVRDTGCGGIGFPYYSTKNIKAEETSNGIRIYQKVVYIKTLLNEQKNGFFYEIYKPYKMTLINKITADPSTITNYFDDTDTYMLTFKKNKDGNYYFAGSEIVN